MTSEAPERIWLQWDAPYGENSLCEDQINDDDVGYTRDDLHQKALDRIEALEAEVSKAREEGRRAGLEEAAALAKAGPNLPDRSHLRQSDFMKLSEEIRALAQTCTPPRDGV